MPLSNPRAAPEPRKPQERKADGMKTELVENAPFDVAVEVDDSEEVDSEEEADAMDPNQ